MYKVQTSIAFDKKSDTITHGEYSTFQEAKQEYNNLLLTDHNDKYDYNPNDDFPIDATIEINKYVDDDFEETIDIQSVFVEDFIQSKYGSTYPYLAYWSAKDKSLIYEITQGDDVLTYTEDELKKF